MSMDVPTNTAQKFLVSAELEVLRRKLLAWYDRNRRDLPWRRTQDPYAIWISEIMLQQTRVAAVISRYSSFLQNFPTVVSLAHAPEQEVLAEWSGLGYYRRARMLHKAAKMVANELGGQMPSTAAGLRMLPGVGAYTAAAIASIAFGESISVVDGNVERVIQRLAGWGSESKSGRSALMRETERLAQQLLDSVRPGDFNQALMELGATVCLPQSPDCPRCPIRAACATRGEHATPRRPKMLSKDAGYGLVVRSTDSVPSPGKIQAVNRHREVLLVQRPFDQTVMPGMWELPTLRDPQVAGSTPRMILRHAIMQINYYVRIRTVLEEESEEFLLPSPSRRWVRLRELGTLPLTGLARKVLQRAKLAEPTAGLVIVDKHAQSASNRDAIG